MRAKSTILISLLFCALCGCASSNLPELDKVMQQILNRFTSKMQKEGLYAAGLGGGSNKGKINLLDVCFNYCQELDVSLSRKLIVSSATNLLELINDSDQYDEFFEKMPVNENVLLISIIGRNKKEVSCDYVHIVSIISGKIYYQIDSAKPSFPPFTTIHEETFEEAKRILVESAENKCL